MNTQPTTEQQQLAAIQHNLTHELNQAVLLLGDTNDLLTVALDGAASHQLSALITHAIEVLPLGDWCQVCSKQQDTDPMRWPTAPVSPGSSRWSYCCHVCGNEWTCSYSWAPNHAEVKISRGGSK